MEDLDKRLGTWKGGGGGGGGGGRSKCYQPEGEKKGRKKNTRRLQLLKERKTEDSPTF